MSARSSLSQPNSPAAAMVMPQALDVRTVLRIQSFIRMSLSKRRHAKTLSHLRACRLALVQKEVLYQSQIEVLLAECWDVDLDPRPLFQELLNASTMVQNMLSLEPIWVNVFAKLRPELEPVFSKYARAYESSSLLDSFPDKAMELQMPTRQVHQYLMVLNTFKTPSDEAVVLTRTILRAADESVDCVEGILASINTALVAGRNARALVSLGARLEDGKEKDSVQRLLHGSDTRTYVTDRPVLVKGETTSRKNKRHVFLFDDTLVYAAEEAGKKRTHAIKHVIPFSTIRIESLVDTEKAAAVRVLAPGREYVMYFDSPEEVSFLNTVLKPTILNYLREHVVDAKAAARDFRHSYGWSHQFFTGTFLSQAFSGDYKGMEAILGAAASPADASAVANSADVDGNTALQLAAYRGHTQTVKFLSGAPAPPGGGSKGGGGCGVQLNTADKRGNTALHLACLMGHAETARCLMDAGAAASATNNDGHTSAHSCIEGAHVHVLEVMCSANGYVESRQSPYTPLMYAAQQNASLCVEVICRLSRSSTTLGKQLNINSTDINGQSALHYAAMASNFESAQKLLEWGAKMNVPDSRSCTVAKYADSDMGGLLAQHGCRFDAAALDFFSSSDSNKVKMAGSVFKTCKPGNMPPTYKVQAQWVDDSESSQCMLCTAKFSVFSRKHHCRHCGALLCGDCSSKTWGLPEEKSQGQVKQQRVCDCCFNQLRMNTVPRPRPVEKAPAQPTSQEAGAGAGATDDKNRAALFGAAAVGAGAVGVAAASSGGDDGKKYKSGLTKDSSAAEISNTMGDARRKLEERKEKLDNMADKSKDLMDDADEFERMCRKLAENEKKKSSWW